MRRACLSIPFLDIKNKPKTNTAPKLGLACHTAWCITHLVKWIWYQAVIGNFRKSGAQKYVRYKLGVRLPKTTKAVTNPVDSSGSLC